MSELDSIFGTIDESDTFGVGALLPPEARLSDAIETRNYPRAYAILRKLDRPLEGDMAADCLIQSFSRTDKLFYTVLEHLSPEVRTGSMHSASRDGESHMTVKGTLLVLAAALGQETHVRALLARGFDVNAATPESAVFDGPHGLGFHPFEEQPYGPRYRFCAAPGNTVTVTNPDGCRVSIHGCTPLAAAIAAGNVFTLHALLSASGVWKTESSAVCRAAALHAEGRSFNHDWVMSWDGSQEAYRPHGVDPLRFLDIRDALFPYVNMQPGSFADFCSSRLLQTQYRSGRCTDADARAVLAALNGSVRFHRLPRHITRFKLSPSDDVAAKMLLTARHFPAACREPRQRSLLLRAYLHSLLEDEPKPALLKCWRKLSGPDRDISDCARLLFHLRGEALKNCLAAMAEGGSLHASADSLHPDSITELREMLRWIRVIPSPFRTGISAFAGAALALSPDARLLRKLICGGPLMYEPKEALLRAADIRSRPMILTSAFSEPAETYAPLLTGSSFHHDCCLPNSERAARAEAMLFGQMEETECLLYLSDQGILEACCEGRSCHGFPALESSSLTEELLCAENPAALRAWLQICPEAAGGMLQADVLGGGAMRAISGPPLAVAAAAGRTENVRTLLALEPQPDACCCATIAQENVPCTPFLLALWFGREETARALLDAGAACALDRGAANRFFRAMPPEGRALAARLPGIGYERAAAREAEGAA